MENWEKCFNLCLGRRERPNLSGLSLTENADNDSSTVNAPKRLTSSSATPVFSRRFCVVSTIIPMSEGKLKSI